jgi:hypothetical protein
MLPAPIAFTAPPRLQRRQPGHRLIIEPKAELGITIHVSG